MFEDCDSQSQQFNTIEAWVYHMMWQHTVRYSCQFTGHEDLFFGTRKEFEQHLTQYHSESFSVDQKDTILQKALRPVPDVFAALAAALRQSGTMTIPFCPLCDFAVEDVPPSLAEAPDLEFARLPEDVHKEVRDHIATHLEKIALLCLPERDELQEDISNELQHGSTERSLRSEGSYMTDLDLKEVDWDAIMASKAPDVLLQEEEGVTGMRRGFFETTPFQSSQLGFSETTTDNDLIIARFARSYLGDVQHYLQHDIAHVREKFPQCPKDIVRRLGTENTRRRRRLQMLSACHQESIATAGESQSTITKTAFGEDPKPIMDLVATKTEEQAPGSQRETMRVYSPATATSSEHSIGQIGYFIPKLNQPFECFCCFQVLKVLTAEQWR